MIIFAKNPGEKCPDPSTRLMIIFGEKAPVGSAKGLTPPLIAARVATPTSANYPASATVKNT